MQTIGVEMDKLTTRRPLPELSFEVREIGGVMLQLWPQYYHDCGMLLYVIDASQTTQVSAACVELYHTLEHEALSAVPVLIFLNKMDLPSSLDRGTIDLLFRLPELMRSASQPITVVEGSAVTGAGLDEVLSWVCEHRAHLSL
jgi:signal recognition particle receptor subunit beta